MKSTGKSVDNAYCRVATAGSKNRGGGGLP